MTPEPENDCCATSEYVPNTPNDHYGPWSWLSDAILDRKRHGAPADPAIVSRDMYAMHAKYKVHEAMAKMDPATLREFLKFRFNFLQEEVNEGKAAVKTKDLEGIVDSLIDLVVVAVGTLDLLNVDFETAWNEVLLANLNKQVGVKESRPNPLGLPDLVKPEGWVGPNHNDNIGILWNILKK